MHKLLTEPQMAVLRWIAEGTPSGVYEAGFEHRITARALERRGLVKVRGHGASWSATVTPAGVYYVAHGRYAPAEAPKRAPAPTARSAPERTARPAAAPVEIMDLLGQLREAGGALRLEAPTDVDRVSYRRAVEHVRAAGQLASDERIKLNGARRGPLVVKLVQVSTTDEPVIVVPDEPDPRDPAVRAAQGKLREVSDSAMPRALAVVQAIAHECAARGWAIAFDEKTGFAITIGEDAYRCRLLEERENRDVFPEADIAKRKYDWQRVSATRMSVPTGRLRLVIGEGYRERWWADRKRWTLASKLPDFFAALDKMSAAERERRARLEQANREDLAFWEQSVARAHELHLHALNAQRARAQAASWRQANDLRAYADEIASRWEEKGASGASSEWVSWLRDEADRIDPLLGTDDLRVETPEKISHADLDKHMPKGWTSYRAPAPPKWLPS